MLVIGFNANFFCQVCPNTCSPRYYTFNKLNGLDHTYFEDEEEEILKELCSTHRWRVGIKNVFPLLLCQLI